MEEENHNYRGYRLEPASTADGVWLINFYPLWLRLPAAAKPDMRHYASLADALRAGRAQVDRLLAGLPDRRGWPPAPNKSEQQA